MDFNAAELAALRSRLYRLGIFFRLDTEPDPVRLWLGFGKIEPGVNAFDSSGATYLGFGAIRDVPAFKSLLNGAAERIDFGLSGVSGEILQKASINDVNDVKGKRTAIGFGLMGSDWSMIGAVHWLATYRADYLSLQQVPTSDPNTPIVRSLVLSCGSRFTSRRRPGLSYFTDVDQQARHPGDDFFGEVSSYAHGFTMVWPIYS